jgi:hypothetical protein
LRDALRKRFKDIAKLRVRDAAQAVADIGRNRHERRRRDARLGLCDLNDALLEGDAATAG